jgi:anaerobic selenocysteine-containing dehydrogenase
MANHDVISFCRTCAGYCGMVVSRDDDGRITHLKPDRSHPMSVGYACYKGLQAVAAHNGPDRILHPLKRLEDGSFVEITYQQALDEIAVKLRELIRDNGPDSIGLFRGTASFNNAVFFQMQVDFMSALGSQSFFSTATIDQSAKIVTADRLGSWNAGRHGFHESDVMIVVGGNPIVSMALQGFENFNTTRAVKMARARGMKFIVIDPRRTEMAEQASVFLQLRPGEDCTLVAGMLRIILAEGWQDTEFCDSYVQGLDQLREAVEPFSADYVARRAGVAADDLYNAAALFARDSRKGIATTGTGPCMSPHSNLADHLVETLNVVCGRFLRSGDRVPNPGVLSAPRPFRAEVVPPGRHWEDGPQSRIRGMGKINNELTAATMADEILTPGPGQVRALIVAGGNPVNAVPDQRRTVRGLKALDCLVSIEPYMTNTARLSHYILPPVLFFERPGIANMTVEWETAICRRPFQQYSEPVAVPPAGADVMDDAVILWELAKRMQLDIVLDGVPLDMTTAPTHDGMLELLTRNSRIPLSEVKKHPHGKVFELDVRVEPGRPNTGRFDVAPADVVRELTEYFGPGHEHDRAETHAYTLISRRMRDAMNSYGTTIEPIRRRHPFNPIFIHPDDLALLGVSPGELVQIASDAGTVEAVAAADETMRRGVVAMTHSWGDRLPDEDGDPRVSGSSTSLLISVESDYEPINAMPRLSGIPVDIKPLTHAQ